MSFVQAFTALMIFQSVVSAISDLPTILNKVSQGVNR